jgi:hypothetical protein
MKLEIKNYKCSKEEFESMSIIDKRTYIIQTEQEDTMWWSRTYYKIGIFGFIIGLVIAAVFILSHIK